MSKRTFKQATDFVVDVAVSDVVGLAVVDSDVDVAGVIADTSMISLKKLKD